MITCEGKKLQKTRVHNNSNYYYFLNERIFKIIWEIYLS